MLEGQVTLFVGGEQIVLWPGQAAFAPRDVPHAYRVESAQARWLLTTTPAGFDAFVREIAEPAPADELPPAGRPVDPAEPFSGRRQGRHRDPRAAGHPAGLTDKEPGDSCPARRLG